MKPAVNFIVIIIFESNDLTVLFDENKIKKLIANLFCKNHKTSSC